jgi:hypothetical protein
MDKVLDRWTVAVQSSNEFQRLRYAHIDLMITTISSQPGVGRLSEFVKISKGVDTSHGDQQRDLTMESTPSELKSHWPRPKRLETIEVLNLLCNVLPEKPLVDFSHFRIATANHSEFLEAAVYRSAYAMWKGLVARYLGSELARPSDHFGTGNPSKFGTGMCFICTNESLTVPVLKTVVQFVGRFADILAIADSIRDSNNAAGR